MEKLFLRKWKSSAWLGFRSLSFLPFFAVPSIFSVHLGFIQIRVLRQSDSSMAGTGTSNVMNWITLQHSSVISADNGMKAMRVPSMKRSLIVPLPIFGLLMGHLYQTLLAIFICQFVGAPTSVHYAHLLRVLRYLRGTTSRSLFQQGILNTISTILEEERSSLFSVTLSEINQ
ncbi:hypothetical protein J5N97_026988 [Dioscorea zingiberensis]|uniref:Uncharacterized protein n=1 Tax=Dioscorea zingiberensis TaxID=325984 RepID=A0A9D5H797_9LILI|nr:hypothetical protein J5N97_026988 [Dioscorea zingiberensis]